MSEIQLIKFTSGEEIICTILSQNDDQIHIEDGVTLVYHQNEQGSVSVGFSPYMPYSDGTIHIKAQSIQSISIVKSELLNEYKRVFSKIVIAPASTIIM
jgi:hypothetical protein